MSLRRLVLSIVGAAVFGMAGGGVGETEAAIVKVIVKQGAQEFTPQQIMIKVGDRVIWVSEDREDHFLVSAGAASRPAANGADILFINTVLRTGTSHAHTFVEAGTYHYFCASHTQMWGTVIVEE